MKQQGPFHNQDAKTIVIQTSSPIFNLACVALIGGIGLTMTYISQRQNKRQQTISDTAVMPASLNTKTQQLLHDMLDDYFSEQELRDVCLDMGVDYEDLPAAGQSYKARELVGLCSRLGKIAELQAIIQEQRPHLFPEKSDQSTAIPTSLPDMFFPQNETHLRTAFSA